MNDLPIKKGTWHHADDLTPLFDGGIRQGSHEPNVAPSIYETPAPPGDSGPRRTRRLQVRRIVAIARAAEDAN